MFSKLTKVATDARRTITDAVSDVDLTSVKGKISSIQDAAGDAVSSGLERITHPADAYDRALDDLLSHAQRKSTTLHEALDELRAGNPYR
jgi:Lhr-like helicase